VSRSNAGDGAPKTFVSLVADMETYDRLPSEVRQKLRGMVDNWAAVGAERILRKHGAPVCLTVLETVDSKMRAAA
jgi:hypothetical protein